MDPLTILLFVFLFFLSAFFSGTELALMSIAPHKLDAVFKEGKFGSSALKKIKENNDRLLITILIGNNLVNVYTAALATSIAIGIAEASGLEQALAVGIATGIITFLLLLFGEIIPKSFATKNAVSIALFVAPIYKILMVVLYPIILFIEIIIKFVTPKEKKEFVSDEEIESFLDMGKDAGSLDKGEHQKLKNLLEFGDILAEEIMVPRVNIDAIDMSSTLKQAKEYYLSHTHSRIPVFSETIDRIDHFFTIRDIINITETKALSELELPKVMKVPLNQPIDKLLEDFQKSHTHMAIVIDEYGGVAGIVTLEDVIEEIFGEIRDETDKEIDDIKKLGLNHYKVESGAIVDDVLEKFNLELEQIGLSEREFGGEALSYVLTYKIKRFPKLDEEILFKIFSDHYEENVKNTLSFKILEISEGRIGKVEVKLLDS